MDVPSQAFGPNNEGFTKECEDDKDRDFLAVDSIVKHSSPAAELPLPAPNAELLPSLHQTSRSVKNGGGIIKKKKKKKRKRVPQGVSVYGSSCSSCSSSSQQKGLPVTIKRRSPKLFIGGGRRSIAGVAAQHQIRELLAQVPDGSQDSTSRDDGFSQVMGPKHLGRVRRCGLGPTPTLLWRSSSSHAGTYSADPQTTERLRALEESISKKDSLLAATQSRLEVLERIMQELLQRQIAGHPSTAPHASEEQAWDPDGQEPDRMQMYHMMHIRRDGTFVDQASADLYTQMDELVSQHPEGTTSSTARNEVFTQVMGLDTHGRVRTYGLGVKPSRLRSADSDQWRRRAEELASQNESLVAKQDEIRAELVAMNSRMKVFEDWMSHMGGASHIPSGSTPVPYMDPDATQTPDDTDFL